MANRRCVLGYVLIRASFVVILPVVAAFVHAILPGAILRTAKVYRISGLYLWRIASIRASIRGGNASFGSCHDGRGADGAILGAALGAARCAAPGRIFPPWACLRHRVFGMAREPRPCLISVCGAVAFAGGWFTRSRAISAYFSIVIVRVAESLAAALMRRIFSFPPASSGGCEGRHSWPDTNRTMPNILPRRFAKSAVRLCRGRQKSAARRSFRRGRWMATRGSGPRKTYSARRRRPGMCPLAN